MIDLIYVEYADGRTMSVAIAGEPGIEDRLLGPVPGENSVSALAPLLLDAAPGKFENIKAAEQFLSLTHFRNIMLHTNQAGQDYPFRINAPMEVTS